MAKRKAASSSVSGEAKKSGRKKVKPTTYAEPSDDVDVDVDLDVDVVPGEEEEEELVTPAADDSTSPSIQRAPRVREDHGYRFIGDPIPAALAKSRWPNRYTPPGMEGGWALKARRHYATAEVDQTIIFNLDDYAHVNSDNEDAPYICKIVEFFEGVDGHLYFRAQWCYRSRDTVIKEAFCLRETKRIFSSEIEDDNPLGCLLEKIKVIRVKPNLDIVAKESAIAECTYYYDMKYLVPFSSFVVPSEATEETVSDIDDPQADEQTQMEDKQRSAMTLLDLYSGCGGMSTGLCLGANLQGTNLVTKWAVDINTFACDSLKLNHPETEVRNESADDFLVLLKEWSKLCASYSLIKSKETHEAIDAMVEEEGDDDEEDEEEADVNDGEVFEVEEVIGVCYGDPKGNRKTGLHFKVRWRGYGPEEDTWEPVDGLGNCRERIGHFVKTGFMNKTLPLPGDVDVVCGGPPCQGLSGFNRFRNKEKPLADPKNKQLLVYMDIIDYLKPKFVLMENVVDLLKFANGYCGRYALAKLVDLNYQARVGMMAAGSYGLPQFRMRVFLWGALPTESLPQYPLPTHEVVYRGVVPTEFEQNVVKYDKDEIVQLEEKLFLRDAISDLPNVQNDEGRDEIPYGDEPETAFQRYIRRTKESMTGPMEEFITTLYDHRPLQLNLDDYQRVCQIPNRKGANFRDLPGVRVRSGNKVEFDPDVPRVLLPSGRPLVPDYAMSFVRGTSVKPFGRLWYDETVPTVVTRAEPHNQRVCHPFQDRVLTIRENARLQGFPDYYQLKGTIKERYIQVGNAVAVPVARALGYSLALANQGLTDEKHVLKLPTGFPLIFPEVEVNN